MDGRYAAMMGCTYEEVVQNFDEHIEAIAQAQSRTEEDVLTEIKTWYNGYRFSSDDAHVYNPYLGLNISSKDRNIDSWAGVLLDERGEGRAVSWSVLKSSA